MDLVGLVGLVGLVMLGGWQRGSLSGRCNCEERAESRSYPQGSRVLTGLNVGSTRDDSHELS